jgi:hypothetical protein
LRRAVAPRRRGTEHAIGSALGDAAIAIIPFLLVPSSVGPEFRFPPEESSDFRFVLGWPFQIPLPFDSHAPLTHRLAIAPEVALGAADHAVFRGRLGYRFGGRWFVAGLGAGADKTAVFISPELGIRYPETNDSDLEFGGLLGTRFDYEPAHDAFRVSVTLGWVLL